MSEEEITDTNEQIEQRRQKLAKLREQGSAFPNDFKRRDIAKEILDAHATESSEDLEENQHTVILAGRLMTRRLMGKASFIHLQDVSGRIQIYIRKDTLPEGIYDHFLSWDLGDIVGVEGVLFRTKTGELSVKAKNIRLLTKALRPLPDKWHGLTDNEMRYRQRYVDLIANEKSRQVFLVRSKVIQAIRDFLLQHNYLEVETSMMQPIPGGAIAKPFITHHNALSIDLYLRVSPELYLKRLVVGGFERVFEINRNFRNEGLSTRHNPEFTMLEFYQAYADYQDLMNLSEQMLQTVVKSVLGTHKVVYQGIELDFSKPFQRLTILEAIVEFCEGITMADLNDQQALMNVLTQQGIECDKSWGIGQLQLALFEERVEDKLQQPIFITHYPMEVSPLARRNDENPEVCDRAELFIAGREIANLFSELNDPEDQAERFRKQVAQKEAGDEEAMYFDADYITALEHGLPPTAGEGIGIDRLVMLLTDSPSIKDVILFPHMRPTE